MKTKTSETKARELISQLIGLQSRDATNVTQTKLYNLNYVDSFSPAFLDAIKKIREEFSSDISVVFERNLSGDNTFPDINDSIHLILKNVNPIMDTTNTHIQVPVSKLMESNIEMYTEILSNTEHPMLYYEGRDYDNFMYQLRLTGQTARDYFTELQKTQNILHPYPAKILENYWDKEKAKEDMHMACKIEIAKKLSPQYMGLFESRVKDFEDLFNLSKRSIHDRFTTDLFKDQGLSSALKELKDMTRTIDGLQKCMNYELKEKEGYEAVYSKPYDTSKSIFHFADKQVAQEVFNIEQAKNEYLRNTIEQEGFERE